MTTPGPYRFHKATSKDLALLATWQATPHVREWWGSEMSYSAADLADPRVARWIVSHADQPFAFMQDYTVHGWDEHHFAGLPKGARGIDQYIGDPEMLGLGHGSAFIKARLHTLIAQGAPVIATDPHPDNARAIAVYQKLGFRISGAARDTQWGVILPMLLTAPAPRGPRHETPSG